jgi:hypothetical protein
MNARRAAQTRYSDSVVGELIGGNYMRWFREVTGSAG